MAIELARCTPNDVDALSAIGAATFTETFDDANDPENMRTYIRAAYAPRVLAHEVADPRSSFFLARVDGQAAGYLKLNVGGAQTEDVGPSTLEVQRIYVLRTFKRLGLGTRMMCTALDEAARLRKDTVWLGVWEHNDSARSFYERMGFTRFGSHTFALGDSLQTDFLMSRQVNASGDDAHPSGPRQQMVVQTPRSELDASHPSAC